MEKNSVKDFKLKYNGYIVFKKSNSLLGKNIFVIVNINDFEYKLILSVFFLIRRGIGWYLGFKRWNVNKGFNKLYLKLLLFF